MFTKSYLASKLSDFIFLNINKDALASLFRKLPQGDIYMPMKASKIIGDVKTSGNIDKIDMKDLIEGMFFVIGCDEKFNYSKNYMDMLKDNEFSSKLVKGIIAKNINENNEADAYLLLRGLYIIEPSEDVYDKLLYCLGIISESNKDLESEKDGIINVGKEFSYKLAYLYESKNNYDKSNYIEAWDNLNLYFSYGGKSDESIEEFRNDLNILSKLQEAKGILIENPKHALELLVPLLDECSDNATIPLYIAMACRNLGLYEKAIYYLNEAKNIDNEIIEIYNEFGLNFACLGDFPVAINYFKKSFEVTKSIEICTNIIMCYLNMGDNRSAKLHLKIAEKLAPEDDVVSKLKNILREAE